MGEQVNSSVFIVYSTRGNRRIVRGVFSFEHNAIQCANKIMKTLDESFGVELQEWILDDHSENLSQPLHVIAMNGVPQS